jgi:hypothetical protein
MHHYLITITADHDDPESADARWQATIPIDTSSGQPRATGITLSAPDDSALSAGIRALNDLEPVLHLFRGAAEDATVTTGARGAAPAVTGSTKVAAAPVAARPVARRGTASSGGSRRAAKERVTYGPSGRAYRHAPDAAALQKAYEEIGTVSGVADHFGVPVHTAQGWLSRMRRKDSTLAVN